MARANDLHELFMGEDSDDEFLGFVEADIQHDFADFESDLSESETESSESDSDSDEGGAIGGRRPIPTAYYHPWLKDFEETVGPRDMPDDLDETKVFCLFMNDAVIMDIFVRQTNLYAQQFIDSHPNLPTYSRARNWKEVELLEMKAFLAIILLMGVDKRSSYKLYWSTDNLIEMKGFRNIMSRDRFLSILMFFHLNDNTQALPRDHVNHDRAFKVRPLIEALVPLWQKHFVCSKETSIDEFMIPFKGHTSLLQYMPAKPNKWGIKAWGLVDAPSGYMWNWSLYLGKDAGARARPDDTPVSQHVVVSLATPLRNLGHICFMDNFFSSPATFKALEDIQIGACGTLRCNRRGVPDVIKNAKPKSGEPAVTERDGNTLYISWFDKKNVSLMTSVHSAITYRKQVRSKRHDGNFREVDKPVAMQQYSMNMGGIDRADKAMTYYMMLHRCSKWWKKVFFYLLEICFCNSLIIWRHLHPRTRVEAEQFRLSIVHGLLSGYQRPQPLGHGRAATNPPDRLIGGDHFPCLNPKRVASGKRSNPDCIVCSDRTRKRHQTSYMCRKCDRPMCPVPCFERYHTMLNFTVPCTPDLHL